MQRTKLLQSALRLAHQASQAQSHATAAPLAALGLRFAGDAPAADLKKTVLHDLHVQQGGGSWLGGASAGA